MSLLISRLSHPVCNLTLPLNQADPFTCKDSRVLLVNHYLRLLLLSLPALCFSKEVEHGVTKNRSQANDFRGGSLL